MHPTNPAFSFLNTIKYTFADDTTTSDAMICLDHDHALLKPQVISTWMPSGVGSKPGKRVIFAETQVCKFANVSNFNFNGTKRPTTHTCWSIIISYALATIGKLQSRPN